MSATLLFTGLCMLSGALFLVSIRNAKASFESPAKAPLTTFDFWRAMALASGWVSLVAFAMARFPRIWFDQETKLNLAPTTFWLGIILAGLLVSCWSILAERGRHPAFKAKALEDFHEITAAQLKDMCEEPKPKRQKRKAPLAQLPVRSQGRKQAAARKRAARKH